MNHKLPSFLTLVMAAFVIAAGFCPAVAAQARAVAPFDPIRSPATPLIVRQPYVSVWQASDALNTKWPSFWAGRTKGMSGLIRIDGTTYTFLGQPLDANGEPYPVIPQIHLQITATQSIYTFANTAVKLTVDFLSPVDPTDLRRQSIPLGYVRATASSTDGANHKVELYFDISAQWADGDENASISWQKTTIPNNVGAIVAFAASPVAAGILQENNDSATWGQAVWATRSSANLTTQAGADQRVRSDFAREGLLDNSVDSDQPRAINDNWPVFAFAYDLGTVGKTSSNPIFIAVGNVRNPAVSYQGIQVPPLWLSYWPNWSSMTSFFLDDEHNAFDRADKLDTRIASDAISAGGIKYAAICDLAFRQAFGATELVGTRAKPWLFMKEISSDGNISTIDVVYPSFPVFLYANPSLLRLQLDPLLNYAESGKWPQPYAEHDIGSSYPRADGHNDGGGENMPVEESANILILAAAYLRYAPLVDARSYAAKHYKILKQWADYLLTVPAGGSSPNALDPQFQNQTDDFTGPIAHSVNLALKGILGVGAMGQIAGYAGNLADERYYSIQSKSMISKWAHLSQSKSGRHLLMQYIEADTPQPSNWGAGVVGNSSLKLSGAGDAETPSPVVDTTKSYTVSAWVRPTTINGYQTYIGIDGASVSGFFLQVVPGGSFSFSALEQDTNSPGNPVRAVSLSPAAPGTWYHLAGVYNSDAHTVSLFVDGALQATAPYLSAFNAKGATTIGRGLYNGNHVDFANASVEDVRFYQAALSQGEVAALADEGGSVSPSAGQPAAPRANIVREKLAAYWPLDDGMGGSAVDDSGNGNTLELKGTPVDPQDAWSLKYNAFPDKILGLHLIPAAILNEEAAFYKTQLTPYGTQLDIRHDYTKADWELWTAASTNDSALRTGFVDGVYNFANTSNARVPFSDWYDAKTGQQVGFQARPVIGGVFAILDRTALVANK